MNGALSGDLCHSACARQPPCNPTAPHQEFSVLDVIYVALTIVLFVIVGLVAKGVEKL